MSPRIRNRVFQIVLIALALGAGTSAAQTGDLSDLKSAIERNEELLHQAANLVRQTSSSKARASLDAARKLHEYSKQLVASSQLELAVRVTFKARQAILNTINIAKREARLEESAMKTMERAAIRLQQARTIYQEYGERDDVPVRKLIEEAYHQLQRARDNMREHLFDIALQLSNASLDMSNRAIQLLKRDSLRPEDVFREIERTDNIIERLLSRDEPAMRPSTREIVQQAVAQAIDLQNRAKHNARSDNFPLALQQTHRAREIAMRIARGAAAAIEPDRERVARAISFTEELFERAREIAQQNAMPQVLQKIEEAARMQTEARSKFNDEQYRAAMTLTQRARDIARRSLAAMDKPLNEESVRTALDRTEEAIERLSDPVSQSDNDTVRSLLQRARDRQAGAREAWDSGDLRRALALTRVARSLARRAMQELGADEML